MRLPSACWLLLLLLMPRFCFCWELNERQIPAAVFNSRFPSQHESHHFPPPLRPVLLPSPCSAGAGAEAGGSSDWQGVVGFLASEGVPVSDVGTLGWKKCSSGVTLMLDGAYMAPSPAVGTHQAMLQGGGGSGCCPGIRAGVSPGTEQGVLTRDTRESQERQNTGRLRDETKGFIWAEANQHSWEVSLHRLSIHFSGMAARWGLGCELS